MFDVKNLNSKFFMELNPEEVLEIKELTTDEKVECFKFFLTDIGITNVSVISNIFLLINGISSIDEDTLSDKRVFFNSLEEYVDVKLQIRYEIDDFNIRLLEYYLGVIEGLDVNLDELKVHIPNTYFNIMHLVTPNLISKLMLKYLSRIDCKKIEPVFCAKELYAKVNNQDSLILGFLQSLMGEVGNNNDLNSSGIMR